MASASPLSGGGVWCSRSHTVDRKGQWDLATTRAPVAWRHRSQLQGRAVFVVRAKRPGGRVTPMTGECPHRPRRICVLGLAHDRAGGSAGHAARCRAV